MLESNNEMDGIVTHLVSRAFRLEIERAEAAVSAARGVKFRIQVEHALARYIDNAEIGITGTLDLVVRSPRNIAAQARGRIQKLTQQIFEVTTHFVNAPDILNSAVGRVELLQ